MGGADDPRIGTKTSTADPDFMLRNFVWLLSTNTLYVVDIREPSFSDVDVAPPTPRAATPRAATPRAATPRAATPSTPRDVSRSPRPSPASLLMNEEFATVDVRFFCGHVLFDINFFTAPAGDNRFVGVPLVCPSGGIDPTLELRALFGAAPATAQHEGPERARLRSAAAAVVHRLSSARSAALRAALSEDGTASTISPGGTPRGTGGAFGIIARRRLPAEWRSTVLAIMAAQAEAVS